MAATAPASDVEICNLALDYLNQDPITSIDTPVGRAAEACARHYHQTRRAVLRKHLWNWATKRDALAEASVDIPFGYDTAFALPSDFVRLVAIGDETSGLPTNDDDELLIRYIYDITDVTKFDALFVELLALEIAIKLCPKFSASEGKKQELRDELKRIAPSAYSVDGQERPPTRTTRSRWISRRTRGRSRSYGSPYATFDAAIPSPLQYQLENSFIYTSAA